MILEILKLVGWFLLGFTMTVGLFIIAYKVGYRVGGRR